VIYEEKIPNKYLSVSFLVIFFCLLYSPWNLGLRELLSSEGKFAVIALENNFSSFSALAHGETLANTFPLFPYLVSILYKSGFSLEIGIRLVSILSLAAIVVVVFIASMRTSGIQPAVVSAGFIMSSYIMLTAAIVGSPLTLGIALMLIGWLVWYYEAAVKGNWNKAWILASIFCGFAFYAIGWISFFYFCFPLIFLRRPLTIWKKLNTWGFKVSLAVIAIFIVLCMLLHEGSANTISVNYAGISTLFTAHYLKGLLTYPFELFLNLLPWSIIAWPPFCAAYQPLDKNPIFSRFLRTVFIALFFLLWLSPEKNHRLDLLLIPPLAILAGMNYSLAVRRNGFIFHSIISVIVWVFTFYAIISLLFFIIPKNLWNESNLFVFIQNTFFSKGFSFFAVYKEIGIVQTLIAVLVGTAAILSRKKISVWMHCLCAALVFMLCFWAVTIPYISQSDETKKTANLIKKDIGGEFNSNLVIYKAPEIADMYVLGSYLGCKIKKIDTFEHLPISEKTVYLLSLSMPAYYTERQWTKISAINYNGRTIYIWKGFQEPKKTIGIEF